MLAAAPGLARAELIGGVAFPLGALSFADAVVTYDLHDATNCETPHADPANALGVPDYDGNTSDANYTCLGNAPATGVSSELVLRFDDNALIDGRRGSETSGSRLSRRPTSMRPARGPWRPRCVARAQTGPSLGNEPTSHG